MMEFTIEDLENLETYDSRYMESYPCHHHDAEDRFGWFCLGHNFDVVATMLCIADISWQKGYDAGVALTEFNHHVEHTENTDTAYIVPLRLRPDSGN